VSVAALVEDLLTAVDNIEGRIATDLDVRCTLKESHWALGSVTRPQDEIHNLLVRVLVMVCEREWALPNDQMPL